MIRRLGYVGIALAPALMGCGEGLSSSNGRVEAVMADVRDPATSYTGVFSGTAQVAISVDGQTWYEMGPPVSLSFNLQASQSRSVHGPVHAPVGDYSHMRLILRNAQVRLASGSLIGDDTVTTQTTLEIGGVDHEVIVEKTGQVVTVQAEGGIGTVVVFDLNTENWINSETLHSLQVPDLAVQESVTVELLLP